MPGWRFSMTMVASFLMVGGQLLMPGVAALCRNWPDRDDWQVLQIILISPFVLMLPYVWWVPPSEGFHSRRGADSSFAEPGDGLYSTHCTTQNWAHSPPANKQCSLSPVVCLLPPSVSSSSCFHNTFCFRPTLFFLSTSFPSLSLQDFSWVVALVAGHPALQTVQSHDAAHR